MRLSTAKITSKLSPRSALKVWLTSQTAASMSSNSRLVISSLVPLVMDKLTVKLSDSMKGKKVVLTKPLPINPGTLTRKSATMAEKVTHGWSKAKRRTGA